MPIIEMVMPKMGESVMEGTILKWLKKVGDKIEQDEPVLEVATDKVDTEIPATHAGILTQILAQEGEVIAIGKIIATIDTQTNGQTTTIVSPTLATEKIDTQNLAQIEQTIANAMQIESGTQNDTKLADNNRFYSPLVMNIAKQEKISMTELASIQGTGQENRVTKNDIFAYIKNRGSHSTHIAPAQITPTETKPAQKITPTPTQTQTSAVGVSYSGAADIIEMDRMRKMIAQRMVESKQTSPHVTTFIEVDVTNIVLWRNKIKDSFKKREGENITFTPIFIEAIAKALRDFPLVNSSVEGDKIIVKKDINIGMAAALPSGNLIVPVIKNADQMNLLGLTKKVNDLAGRARANKLQPDELSGGTYSMSNIGSFGNEMGTPIIMQPQVAILAFGAIKKKPAVIETPTGDMIAIRHLMFISHSYDHRIIDGALGGSFGRKVADYLEAFDINREI
ncbi:MAG: 2-oxo acid dehydrogenase subunit E2 [Bacteroidetes bacterium]|nr:MAG: 2-oxo acid dehydrogenase subunit E2 [Bacteroidota bacterium]TAG95888.1 MAG: 2-oxo acid dehydrogenase subunit E2 [Bacteroidota bacterium]